MDSKRFDELRKKNMTKDFEGKNASLDKWLYYFSFFGNIGSIFFAYFLVYPALNNAIVINLIDGWWSSVIALFFTVIFLSMFEILKRYVIRNFFYDYISHSNKVKISIIGELIVTILLITLSFYLSIVGSKNLANTSVVTNRMNIIKSSTIKDSLNNVYIQERKIYLDEISSLRDANRKSRDIQNSTNNTWERKENDKIISRNDDLILKYENKLVDLENRYESQINDIDAMNDINKANVVSDDKKTALLFIIIVIFNELIIVTGVCFREYFEYKLYILNQSKYEKTYQKRERYKTLIMFIYNEGRLGVGDKVISSLKLKEIISERSRVPSLNKIVDEFFRDMDNNDVFQVKGKRRFINMNYDDVLNIIDNYDDSFNILENLK